MQTSTSFYKGEKSRLDLSCLQYNITITKQKFFAISVISVEKFIQPTLQLAGASVKGTWSWTVGFVDCDFISDKGFICSVISLELVAEL